MSEIEQAAQRWVENVHPHALHLVRTRDWVVVLDPQADEGLRIAAVLHDIERAFPDPDSRWDGARDWDNPHYVRWHQQRCAQFGVSWLAEQGASPELRDEVERLILVHEEGGWPDADMLQAADSLSFLEPLVPLTIGWVKRGVPLERVDRRLRHAEARIQVEHARREALPLLEQALNDLYSGVSLSWRLRPSPDQEGSTGPGRRCDEGLVQRLPKQGWKT